MKYYPYYIVLKVRKTNRPITNILCSVSIMFVYPWPLKVMNYYWCSNRYLKVTEVRWSCAYTVPYIIGTIVAKPIELNLKIFLGEPAPRPPYIVTILMICHLLPHDLLASQTISCIKWLPTRKKTHPYRTWFNTGLKIK